MAADIYFDNDRDLYNRGIAARNALYHNNGDGTFYRYYYDKDGWLELFIADTIIRKLRLLRQGATTSRSTHCFTDRKEIRGCQQNFGKRIRDPLRRTRRGLADFDNDGNMDVLVANNIDICSGKPAWQDQRVIASWVWDFLGHELRKL